MASPENKVQRDSKALPVTKARKALQASKGLRVNRVLLGNRDPKGQPDLTEYRVPLDLKGRPDLKAPQVNKVHRESLACRARLENRAVPGIKAPKESPDWRGRQVNREPQATKAQPVSKELLVNKEPLENRARPGIKVPLA